MPYKNPEERKKYQKSWRKKNKNKIKSYIKKYAPIRRIKQREYRKKNPDKFRQRDHEKYIKHKERILNYSKKRYQKNKDKILAQVKIYRIKNRERIRRKAKEYYQDNKHKRLSYHKKYRKDNKIKLRENQIVYEKKMRKISPSFRINRSLRSLLNIALRRYTNKGKTMPSKKYGIDYQAIIEHLKPFPKDLSKYHVDHIMPLCSFDLTNPDEVKKAFAPENHQWLLVGDNIKKSHLDKKMKFVKKIK